MSAFSEYLAEELTNWLASNTAFDGSPTDLYVTVWDTSETELSGDFPNARLAVNNSNWTVTDSGASFDSRFENANELDLGEATADLQDIDRIAIYDASTGGNLLLTTRLSDAPFDVSSGTRLKFQAGDVNFDVLEYDE